VLSTEFATYRLTCESFYQRLLDEAPTHALDEQALPSYTHSNRLAAWLFWQRLLIVAREIARLRPTTALDFGCGGGVMFKPLADMGVTIHACDLELAPARQFAAHLGLQGIHWHNGAASLQEIPTGYFDCILALDVLEHMEEAELNAVLDRFHELLAPGGHLFVSGPTENWAYKLGRRIAGFSGHYHETNIHAIEAKLRSRFAVRLVARLFPPVVLFRITDSRKPVA
jgi:2-polyprenyl-3-methyl-5-hydroxy-6-metoxy-1,4-benzoquinol methylase